jgi:hypothetical protein
MSAKLRCAVSRRVLSAMRPHHRPMELSGEEIQAMITHWLLSTAGRRFGTTYGSDLNDAIQTPQYGGALENSLGKLSQDVPIVAAGTVNAYTAPVGVDGVDVFIEAGSVMVSVDEVRRGRVASSSSGAELRLTNTASVIVSNTAGDWDGSAVSTEFTVWLSGIDITAQCTVNVVDGPGMSTTRAGNVVSLATVGAAASSVFVDFVATGPFDGQVMRRWLLTKDYSLPLDPYESLVALQLDFDGDHNATTIIDMLNPARVLTAQYGGVVNSTGGSDGGPAGDFSADNYAAFVLPDTPGFVVSGEFCFECRVKFPNPPSSSAFFVVSYKASEGGYFWMSAEPNGSLGTYILGDQTYTAPGILTPGQWQHMAVARESLGGGSWITRVFLDGAVVYTLGPGGGAQNQTGPMVWSVGGPPPSVANYNGRGLMDMLRLTIGGPRYTGPFTPPTGF